ncbi:MAG: 1-deoxy-D-xylulose-5-phosphate synthase [Caldiserica bacterium]|jgi:1-deoxy-D-xylulose-5-phosphate synthase|nr:1-deoxy-D-xylulose-5-phosphate synthase [Caldisericota bacterium]MDH7562933.1 1-deoxy-D-xylulose-5-phosphate synthase [Caldisericota bacterium]
MNEKLLFQIRSPEDLKGLNISQLEELAREIRERIIRQVSSSGGHLSSNLGVVELTLALHYVFQAPQDLILWDVSHQSYAHKLITGRASQFDKLREADGLSGFTSREESVYDVSSMGHSSVALSQALGLRAARDIKGQNHKIIAVMGDGSFTGGVAFEGLNNAGQLKKDLIVILNDNEHSISKNVGAMAKHLAKLRASRKYQRIKLLTKKFFRRFPRFGTWAIRNIERLKVIIKAVLLPSLLFESLGFSYLGPIDGHDLKALIEVLRQAKNLSTPVVVHVATVKGKGYPPAEKDPVFFHSAPPFEVETGKPKNPSQRSFTDVVSGTLSLLGFQNKDFACITAAMADGTGLKEFGRLFPERFFDVGIAEQHAISFAAGLALGGLRPVVALYSTFLQRGFDQLIHDVCLQDLPVIFLIDRAGVVPGDGPTHQGVFDLSFLRVIPNLSILTPSSGEELKDMIFTAFLHSSPVAIRYPKASIPEGNLPLSGFSEIPWGRGVCIKEGKDASILVWGPILQEARSASDILEKEGLSVGIYNLRFLKPLDEALVLKAYKESRLLFTLEENLIFGGAGSSILEFLSQRGLDTGKVILKGLRGVPRIGTREQLLSRAGLDSKSLASEIKEMLEKIKAGSQRYA